MGVKKPRFTKEQHQRAAEKLTKAKLELCEVLLEAGMHYVFYRQPILCMESSIKKVEDLRLRMSKHYQLEHGQEGNPYKKDEEA